MNTKSLLPFIVGPTASGKTRIAAIVAHALGAEIVSADSRHVYRGMTIGTGKDYADYIVEGSSVPVHLIDIVDAGYAYNVYEYKRDAIAALHDIYSRHKLAIVCGGTGLYAEALLKNYSLADVPEDAEFRKSCETRSYTDLVAELSSYKSLHNTTDIDSKKRLIRALEIARYEQHNKLQYSEHDMFYSPLVIGIMVDRTIRRERIAKRLHLRLQEGLIEEIEALLRSGLSASQLIYYGLEYKFVTQYVIGELDKNQMIELLYIAICQFAKRQMTWYRGMERRGTTINWVEESWSDEQKREYILELISKKKEMH